MATPPRMDVSFTTIGNEKYFDFFICIRGDSVYNCNCFLGEVYTSSVGLCLNRTVSLMKKSILLAFFACFSACVARAEVVTPAMAMAAADAWAERNAQFDTGNNATNVITEYDANVTNIVLWHQVSMDGGGCLIIAPVTEIEPVVMALERDPGELPEAHPLRDILTLDMRGRLRFLNLYPESAPSSGGRLRLAASSSSEPEEDEEQAAHKEVVRQEWAEQQQSKWEKLRAPRKSVKSRLGVGITQQAGDSQMKYKVVLPGFESGGKLTHWNQDGDYATYTPGHVVCGCVATAAAAIMQYFRAGEKDGREIKSGQQDAGTTYKGSAYSSSTKGGKYDWANPTGELYGRVTYDAGVAVGMGWNDGGSGASEMATARALVEYFGFAEARYVHNPRPDQYEKLIYAQCRSGAPVGMGIGKSKGGSGHSVVAVGYGIDDDDVERVRVFLGWGGSGDGWYALPYINTKSTLYGEEDLYDILDGIITMIGYENDNVVPVFGRLLPYINPPMTIGGIEYSHEKDGDYFDNIFIDGFFGARVSAAGTANKQVELICAGKSGSVTIGPAASKTERSYISDGDAICKWVPDPIFFPLLNSEVALSFADAREKCIASFETPTNKPVFAFSGNWGEPATDAAWNYLYWLDTEADDATKEAFTNKYIVLCVPYSLGLSSESDGKPSLGIFDGRAISADENKMWSFYNGRLSYWTIGSATYTNDVDEAGFPYTNVVETVDGQFITYAYTNVIDGVSGEGIDYVTGELITNALIRVMETGLTNFLERASGISLAVEAAGFTISVENPPDIVLTSTYGGSDIPGHAEPDYGLYENKYTNGTTIAISAPAFATNAAGNVELACRGYLLSSTNTVEVQTNMNVTTAEFLPVRNGAYTITWLWETNAVKIVREVVSDRGVGTITSDKGDGDWYNVGEIVTFTATGGKFTTTSYDFNGWGLEGKIDGGRVIERGFTADDEYSESGNMFVVKVTHPALIKATFSKRTDDGGTFNLTVKNYGINDGDPMPKTFVGGAELPYNTVTNLSLVSTDVRLETNIDGTGRSCLGWQLVDDGGNALCAMYNLGVVVVPTNYVGDASGDNTVIRQGNGGGLVVNGNDVVDPMTGKVVAEEAGYRIYYVGDTSPLSWVGVNPNIYGITNGASVTLQWLWDIPMEPDDDTTFDIVWNETLDNLHVGYVTNLLTKAEMEDLGARLDDLTVTAPVGWIATKSLDADGNAIATLTRDDAALSVAMDTCTLTIFPNDDGSGKYTVEADITAALRGFWYVLYGSDDLATWVPVASDANESGTSAAQGQGTAENPYSEVNLSIIVTPGDTAAGVKRFYKVVTGATQDPLAVLQY